MYRSVSLVLIVALASVHTTLALPTAESVYPEVIPGPGLPTLAELGLTSAELYQMKPKPGMNTIDPSACSERLTDHSGPEPLVAGFQPTCGIEDRAAVNDVIACFNYLTSVGNNACVIPRGKSQSSFCTSGSAEIVGSATGEATSGESSSW